jgi:predicted extracellular nuclease
LLLPNKASLLFALTLCTFFLIAQTENPSRENTLRVVFYNVENFFDPYPDSTLAYNEFTSSGERHWTAQKFNDKKNKIYQVMAAIGEGELPEVIAFAEIENRQVLEKLIHTTPMESFGYEIIHADSRDERGIDVGLIYRKERVGSLFWKTIPIKFSKDKLKRSRDILYTKFMVGGDTVHLFVNHWPSRYGGMIETEDYRLTAAAMLKSYCDSLCSGQDDVNILTLGDFNDDPSNRSIQYLVKNDTNCLIQLFPEYHSGHAKGSYKYKGEWQLFDQVLCSSALLNDNSSLFLDGKGYYVFDPMFLLEEDGKFFGLKPYRTYYGYEYIGGFSDHLPVFVDLFFQKEL